MVEKLACGPLVVVLLVLLQWDGLGLNCHLI